MATTTFAEPYELSSRITCKASDYSDLRKEIGSTFGITLPELDFLLPKKAKCFEDKLNNGVITYSIESNPPYFIRRPHPHLSQTTQPQAAKNSKNQSKGKDSNKLTILIPTLYALWRLPQLLPSVYTHDDVFPRIASPKPTNLFTPGIVCPDLPDQFLLSGQQHPPHFLQLLPNSLNSPQIREQYEALGEEVNYDGGDSGDYIDTLPQTMHKQQRLYPIYYHNRSFDFVLQPSQLRAIYCTSSPYCVAVGLVQAGYPVVGGISHSNKASDETLGGSDGSKGYISPWGKDTALPRPSLELYFNKALPSKNQDVIDTTLNKMVTWPQVNDVDGGKNGTVFDTNKFIKNGVKKSTLVYSNSEINSISSTMTVKAMIDTHLGLYLKYQKVSKLPASPIVLLYQLLNNSTALEQIFPNLERNQSEKTKSQSIPSKLIQLLYKIQIPSIGTNSNHQQAADISSLLMNPSTIRDNRPYPSGFSLSILHCANDTLTETYKQHYPVDGFEWTSATKIGIKPSPKYINVTRCVWFLLRIAWLSCCVKPILPIPASVSDQIVQIVQITPNDVKNILNGDLGRDDDNDDGDDYNDEDVEYYDEDDEDYEEDEDVQDVTKKTTEVTPVKLPPGVGIGETGICSSCYSARLEWALQYSLSNCIDTFPCQLSEVPKYIRTFSSAPSCLTHIHSSQYAASVIAGSAKKGPKANTENKTITIYCTCPSCYTLQQSRTEHTQIDIPTVITNCTCARRPIELLINSSNNSNYTKISQLIHYGEKLGWLNTKTIKTQQVITSRGSGINIRSSGLDKQSAAETTQSLAQRNAGANPNTPQTQGIVAAIQVIKAVKYQPPLRELLARNKTYAKTIGFNLAQHNNDPVGTIYPYSELSNVRAFHAKGQAKPLNIISYYLNWLYSRDIGVESSIRAAIKEYINTVSGTVAVGKGNVILRKDCKNDQNLPPIVQQLLQNKSFGKNGGNNPHINQDTGVYKGPITVTSQKNKDDNKNAQKGKTKDQLLDDDDNIDKPESDNDIDDLFNAGRNKKIDHSAIKRQQAETRKKEQEALRAAAAAAKKESSGKPLDSQAAVYLCYDEVLYQALGLSKNENYQQKQIDGIIDKFLIPITSASTQETRIIDSLSQNSELIQYLFHQEEEGVEFNNNAKNVKLLPAVQDGLDLIQTNISLRSFDPNTMITSLSSLQFKQIASSIVQAQKTAQASKHQPTILLTVTKFRGKPLTLVIGYELFGISPKDLANETAFKVFMSCSINAVVLAENLQLRQLFPASISERCKTMLSFPGDQSDKIAKHAMEKLNIEGRNVHLINNGKVIPYKKK